MKIGTWNVNGIRARQEQFCELLARDRPEVVCLQELKAELGQIPLQCQLDDYHVFWHGYRAYSGVSLHVRKDAFDAPPSSACTMRDSMSNSGWPKTGGASNASLRTCSDTPE